MKMINNMGVRLVGGAILTLLAIATAHANAVVPGIQGPSFTLEADDTTSIDTPDGGVLRLWAYADTTGGTELQYPGPTLIVNQGDTVTVALTNNLPENTSIVFPGQGQVVASGGIVDPNTVAQEAIPGGTVTYTFTAGEPGTYMYHSGSHADLQVEMGLLGALIVRPAGFDQNANRTAYGTADSAYDHEYLFLMSEMDFETHLIVGFGGHDFVNTTDRVAEYWFVNGRNGLDTLLGNLDPTRPNQPYSGLARTRPGEKVLMRFVGAGLDPHPFHPHGNHHLIIARNGRLLSSNGGASANLAIADFTSEVWPGQTTDAIFTWTSLGLGWDIYGVPGDPGSDPESPFYNHSCTPASGTNPVDPNTGEDCDYHNVSMPVTLPGLQQLAFGGWYSGSPFLGHFGDLPVGEGGNNLDGGLFFMWHSHDEKELTDFDVFPGGMLTFVIIEPPGTPIP
jgi:FtsP/CotA-like multicopper oxidase with cupredoxin domain